MKILIIAPYFPPDEGVGTLRIMSLSKYLINKNYFVSVLTNKKNTSVPSCYAVNIYEVNVNSIEKISNLKKFWKYEREYAEVFNKIAIKNKYDVVIITGGPFYTFLLSIEAKKMNIPCILDFRDPWVFDFRGFQDIISPSKILKRILYFPLERISINHATAVVTVTKGWLKKFRLLYPKNKNKFFLIANGYDDEKLKNLKLQNKTENNTNEITLGVFGKLFYYSNHLSLKFLKAFKNVYEINKNIRIYQVGSREENTDMFLNKVGLNTDIIYSTGFLKYEDGMNELNKIDVFLIIDSRKDALGTKIYDYIYIGKPIIYIGPRQSALASLIREYGNGFICNTKSEIVRVLYTIICRSEKNLPDLYKKKKIEKFSRTKSNEEWERLLKKVVNDNNVESAKKI